MLSAQDLKATACKIPWVLLPFFLLLRSTTLNQNSLIDLCIFLNALLLVNLNCLTKYIIYQKIPLALIVISQSIAITMYGFEPYRMLSIYCLLLLVILKCTDFHSQKNFFQRSILVSMIINLAYIYFLNGDFLNSRAETNYNSNLVSGRPGGLYIDPNYFVLMCFVLAYTYNLRLITYLFVPLVVIITRSKTAIAIIIASIINENRYLILPILFFSMIFWGEIVDQAGILFQPEGTLGFRLQLLQLLPEFLSYLDYFIGVDFAQLKSYYALTIGYPAYNLHNGIIGLLVVFGFPALILVFRDMLNHIKNWNNCAINYTSFIFRYYTISFIFIYDSFSIVYYVLAYALLFNEVSKSTQVDNQVSLSS